MVQRLRTLAALAKGLVFDLQHLRRVSQPSLTPILQIQWPPANAHRALTVDAGERSTYIFWYHFLRVRIKQ